ncbi:MAG: trehalase family glycosidase [bacterium]|nr:trehalase family glycosidase [bacterium]
MRENEFKTEKENDMEKEISKEQAKELLAFIEKKWDDFIFEAKNATRDSDNADDILYLPEKYVAPNQEKFNTMFYWDSYFIIKGLKTEEGRQDLIKGMVDNCLYQVENYGKALNANKKKWSTRSQTPYLAPMIRDAYEDSHDKKWLEKAFDLVKKEYNEYWLDGSHLTPSGLSRFYDESGDKPIGDYKKPHTYKSRAEASWDMSPRFDDEDVHDLLPIDLNCNLYQYEKEFEKFAQELGQEDEAMIWNKKSEERKKTINELMWSEEDGLFYDYNYRTGEQKKIKSLAGYQAMFTGLASQEQAEKMKDNLKIFETKKGLAACDKDYGYQDRQWNYPIVWAPLQYVAAKGMEKYGYAKEAEKINKDFVKLVYDNWKKTGKIWEKYDGEEESGEKVPFDRYPPQSGFGWTNAVAEVFIKETHKM